jgi:hypothetical protein
MGTEFYPITYPKFISSPGSLSGNSRRIVWLLLLPPRVALHAPHLPRPSQTSTEIPAGGRRRLPFSMPSRPPLLPPLSPGSLSSTSLCQARGCRNPHRRRCHCAFIRLRLRTLLSLPSSLYPSPRSGKRGYDSDGRTRDGGRHSRRQRQGSGSDDPRRPGTRYVPNARL